MHGNICFIFSFHRVIIIFTFLLSLDSLRKEIIGALRLKNIACCNLECAKMFAIIIAKCQQLQSGKNKIEMYLIRLALEI